MKHLFIALFLLAGAAPLYANDDGADGTRIPDYQELVREGYGPRYERDGYLRLNYYGVVAVPKPTQAYYGKGFTVYYGYTTVEVAAWQTNSKTAFGYPLDYFRQKLPASIDDVNLSHYALEVRSGNYGPGDYVAQNQGHRASTITKVESVAKTAPAAGTSQLPAIGEKPSH